jgi:hypothetical protein
MSTNAFIHELIVTAVFRQTLELPLYERPMNQSFNLVNCGCGHSFGSTNSKVNFCTKCGSSTNFKSIESFDSAEELSLAVSLENIPNEIRDELISKIKQKEHRLKIKSTKTIDVLDLMKLATDKNGNLSKVVLDKKISDEGLTEMTSEYLLGQAEMQGLLVRVDQNTWNWLS